MTKNRLRVVIAAASLVMLAGCGADSAQTSIEKSRSALEQGELQTASIHIKNALKQEPASATARFLLGRLLLAAGDFNGADIELHKALDNKYPADEVVPLLAQILLARAQYTKLISDYAGMTVANAEGQADLSAAVASAYIGTGQRDKAEALIAKTVTNVPGNIAARLVQSKQLAARGNFDGALKILEDVSAKGARRLDVWRLQGDLLLYGKSDRAGAQAAYHKVSEVLPTDIYAGSQLISIDLLNRDIKAAKQQFEPLARAYPTNRQVKFLEAHITLADGEFMKARDMLAPLLSSQKGDPRVLLLAGTTELQLNAPLRAETYLKQALTANPASAETRRLLAVVALRKGDASGALDMLRPMLDTSAPGADALMIAGEAYLMGGDPKRAEEAFARVAQLNPADVRSRTARAIIQSSTGASAPALNELRAIAAGDTGTLADMALASASLRIGDLDGAMKAIDALDKKIPRQALPADLRGRVFLLKQDLVNSRASFEQALVREPTYFPAAAALARADIAEGNLGKAQQRYETLLKTDPKNVGALVALAGLRARQAAPAEEVTKLLARAIEVNPTNPATRVLLIEYWFTRYNPKQALEAAQLALAAMPDEPSLLESLGRAQLADGQTSQALSTFSKLALQLPRSASVQLRLADAYNQANDPRGAEQALRQALAISPDVVEAQRALMILAMQSKQPEKALQIARDIQRQRPQDAAGYMLEGDVYAVTKRSDAAVKAYRSGLQTNSSGVIAGRLYALLLRDKGQAEADRFAEEWFKQNPKDTSLRWLLAQEAAKTGKLAQAEQYYEAVVALEPDNATALNDLAWVQAKNGKPQAVSTAERAVARLPNNPAALDTLAMALAAANRLERAIEVSRAAVQLAPEASLMRLNLAKLYLQAQDKGRAKIELAEVTKRGKKAAEYQEAAALMKDL